MRGSSTAIPISQHGIENHQPLDHTANGLGLAMPIVWQADGFIQRLVVHVIDATAGARSRA